MKTSQKILRFRSIVRPPRVIATVRVGRGPGSVLVNSRTNLIYIVNNDGTVSVINGRTNQVIHTIDVGPGIPGRSALNLRTNRLYVFTRGRREALSVIDGRTNTVIANIPLNRSPLKIIINQVTNRLFLLDANDTVTVVDGNTNQVIARVRVGRDARDIALNPLTNRIYTVDLGSRRVSVIDGRTNRVIATIRIEPIEFEIGPDFITVNPLTNRIYVFNELSESLAVINGRTNRQIAAVPLGFDAERIRINPFTNRIYLSPMEGAFIAVVSGFTNRVIRRVRIPQPDVADMAINRRKNLIYILNLGLNGQRGIVSVMDGRTNNIINTLRVGLFPTDISVNSNTGRAYVVNNESNTVTVIG